MHACMHRFAGGSLHAYIRKYMHRCLGIDAWIHTYSENRVICGIMSIKRLKLTGSGIGL